MKKKKIENKILKKYTKFKALGKKNIEITNNFYINLLEKIEKSPKKMRKWVYNRLSKSRLILNSRKLIRQEDMNILIDPINKIFYKYQYSSLISLDYYKLSDHQLELFRRIIRQKCGKKVFIELKIQRFYNILRRPNQMRMGGGKGSKFYKKVYFLTPGFIFIEIRIVRKKKIKEAYAYLKKKVPFNFKLLFLNRI